MAVSLNRANLAEIKRLHPEVRLPQYDLNDTKAGIVHFGPSNFFRAFLGPYCDDLRSQGVLDCGIIAVSVQGGYQRRDILKAQDCLYTVVEQNAGGKTARVIGSIKDVLVGPDNPRAVIEAMTSPDIKLVTMTITQGGYYFKKDQALDFDHKDIKESLKDVDQPRATVAYVVEALDRRMKAGLPPFAVMSCDNFQHNSDVLRQTVQAYAGAKSPELKKWIAENVKFYNTMVDRIVPKWLTQSDEDLALGEMVDRFGIIDKWPIHTEDFRQWVIETKAGKAHLPPFDKAGAMFVDDVAPYDEMKIRVLNGVHMALCYVGRNCNEFYDFEALRRPDLRQFAEGYIAEAIGTLNPLLGVDYQQYGHAILNRVSNPELPDPLQRLGRNGIDKLESRFLTTLRDAYAKDLPREHLIAALAQLVNYWKHANEDKNLKEDTANGFYIEDDKAYDRGIIEIAQRLNGDITQMFAIQGLFGGLEHNPVFVKELCEAWSDIVHSQNVENRIKLDHSPAPKAD